MARGSRGPFVVHCQGHRAAKLGLWHCPATPPAWGRARPGASACSHDLLREKGPLGGSDSPCFRLAASPSAGQSSDRARWSEQARPGPCGDGGAGHTELARGRVGMAGARRTELAGAVWGWPGPVTPSSPGLPGPPGPAAHSEGSPGPRAAARRPLPATGPHGGGARAGRRKGGAEKSRGWAEAARGKLTPAQKLLPGPVGRHEGKGRPAAHSPSDRLLSPATRPPPLRREALGPPEGRGLRVPVPALHRRS